MKKFSFLALLAAGMLLGACTSDKDVAGDVTPAINSTGDGYVGFSISLPTANSSATRANDDFNNGMEDEFLVKKARLVLFKGAYDAAAPITSANAATFFKAYDFEGLYENDTQGAEEVPTTKVTSTAVAVAKIDKFTLASGEKLFAYVVINPNGSELSSPSTDETFEHFATRTIAASTIGGTVNGVINGSDGLLMTNSPISDTHGGNTDPTSGGTVTPNVTTAVVLDEQNIKTTKAEAKNAPAGCIFVERAAAKVTVSDVISTANHKITMGSEDVSFTITGWQIINTEKTYYNTRQCEDAWLPYFSDLATSLTTTKYRFVAKDAFAPTLPSDAGHTVSYRTYFARDPHFDSDAASGTMDNTVADVDGTWNGLSDRAFIPENTFDVKHQTWKNTTQVTLRVQFNGGTGFYTLSDDAAKYLKAGAEAKLQNNITSLYDVRTWLTQACDDISSNKAGNKKVTATIAVEIDNTTTAGTKTYTVSVSFKDTDNTPYAVSDITDATIKNKWDTGTDNIKDIAEASQTVTYYALGYAYYNVRIQHFGQFETPWSSSDASALGSGETEYTVNHIYGWDDSDTDAQSVANNRFLGRYGVVRDNWYKLEISGISKLGSATPIDVSSKTEPDDLVEDEYYISAHVHILPWVIRTQNVEL